MIFRVVSAPFFDTFFDTFLDRCRSHFWTLCAPFSDVCSALFSHCFSGYVFGGFWSPAVSKMGAQRGSRIGPKSAQNRAWRRNPIWAHFGPDLGPNLGSFLVIFTYFLVFSRIFTYFSRIFTYFLVFSRIFTYFSRVFTRFHVIARIFTYFLV